MHDPLIGLAAIVVAGIAAQWLAWRLQLPSILLLLLCGFMAGPVTGFIDPDELFGEALFPLVSLSVGLILFEGGLTLKWSELRGIGVTVRNLILFGSIVTWIMGAAAAALILGLDLRLALLLGAILVVTGPTVIVPLLRQVRPASNVGSILKWEGILIDPVGATLALLVFKAILISEVEEATREVVMGVLGTIVAGGAAGAVGALILTQMLRRYWIPDFLQNPVTLMVVIGSFAASNFFQEESGLLAVTIMGVILANQKSVDVHHILEFKENLRVLLISGLFIVLAARLDRSDLTGISFQSVAFVAVLILVVRPVAVGLATLGSKLTWRERVFLGWLAPRGIVAAAVSSVFALRLSSEGIAEASVLAPVTFAVIVGTVVTYGLSAAPVAQWLGVRRPSPQGLLIVGAHFWARDLALRIKEEGFAVALADTNWSNVAAARLMGLPTYYGTILSEHAMEEIDLEGIGRMVALTPNDEVNSLSALHFAEIFGRSEIYQLPTRQDRVRPKMAVTRRLRGRHLFGEKTTFGQISRLFAQGAVIKKTPLTEEFDFAKFKEHYGADALPLMLIDREEKKLRLCTKIDPPKPKPGDVLLSLVRGDAEEKE